MTDFSNIYNCNDLITLMARYLSPKDLNALRLVSNTLKNKVSAATVLQPLYNKLYAIDNTLPARIDTSNPFASFKRAFEIICVRQNKEIAYFKNQQINFPYLSLDSIEALQKTNALLNQINIDKINQVICNRQQGNALQENVLNLFRVGITRFIITEEMKGYFACVKKIFCDENLLSVLNLEDCLKLEEVYCNRNEIKSLVLNKKAPIRWIECSHNLLEVVNFKEFILLENLECSFNNCHVLDLEGCGKIKSVYCRQPDEYLEVLNLKDCLALDYLAIGNGNIGNLSSLKELDLKGTHQVIQHRFANNLEVFLFNQLPSAAYFEREDIIQRLGERYNISNCLKYGCIYDASLIASSKFEWVKIETFFPSRFLTKQSSAVTEELDSDDSLKNKNKKLA